jgi:hypothetical protein
LRILIALDDVGTICGVEGLVRALGHEPVFDVSGWNAREARDAAILHDGAWPQNGSGPGDGEGRQGAVRRLAAERPGGSRSTALQGSDEQSCAVVICDRPERVRPLLERRSPRPIVLLVVDHLAQADETCDDFLLRPLLHAEVRLRLGLALRRAEEERARVAVSRQLALMRIVQGVAEAATPRQALRISLQAAGCAGERSGSAWQVARAWMPDQGGDTLECVAAWHEDPSLAEGFGRASEGVRLSRGRGDDSLWLAHDEGRVVGLGAAPWASYMFDTVAVPIVGTRTLAVLEFGRTRPAVSLCDVEEIVSIVAVHLAGVLADKLSEEELVARLHELGARAREVVDAAMAV